ncbi:DNA polymerase IV [Plantactinospora sp. S1510]|uniref:DNA polymerase IV n=1 Tax=Plantactinospora alkalitolerans TaxID=2789879 RepID=A0ABS0H402_9ACTN|nr:DNA polymerase IV [Plantactinospora alkalitolerans]MBF9132852.1 DNA polymerase IV [Plantactinospora alkalitolerans]
MGRSQSVPRGNDPRFGADADDSGCPILHVDMDAFFVAVEVRRRPELRGRPVVVGGTGPRGVVSSASYEARRYGVRSAMPAMRARALCPSAVFLPPDFAQYTAASRAVMEIFRDVTPLVEPLSLDEAFLHVGGARRLIGRPAEIARLIRARVAEQERITCSVGVASTKFVAKLGSTRAKPDGMIVVPADQVLEFLHPLPVEALWGVGERAAENLRRLGLTTVADIAEAPIGMLRGSLGDAAASHLHELSWGRDPRGVSPEQVEKSIGAEVTFDTDLADPEALRRALLALAEKVGVRLRRAGQVGRTISIKVRFADFRTVNRSRTLGGPTDVAREVFDTAWALFDALGPGDRIRLVGVRVEGLSDASQTPQQLTLGAPEHGWRDAEAAADAAAARFGRSMVRPASLLGRDNLRRTENPARP